MKRFLLSLVALALGAAGLFLWEKYNFTALGPSLEDTVILIKPGSPVAAITQQLETAGLIGNARLFEMGLRLRQDAASLKAGEYAIPAYASLADISAILRGGKSIQHKLTVAEGLTSAMVHALVETDPVLLGDAGPIPPEGALLPETYLFTRGTSRAALLQQMQAAQKAVLDALWPNRHADLPYTTREQVLTLASIVEKETSRPSERPHIASVFVNRLRIGMPLQSDPTIIYGITKGYPLGRPIFESEIRAATPYNTYVISGLPPHPIANPGRDAIKAVLQPISSKDLYFVADGTGGHAFAPNLAGHQANVVKWRKIRAQQNP